MGDVKECGLSSGVVACASWSVLIVLFLTDGAIGEGPLSSVKGSLLVSQAEGPSKAFLIVYVFVYLL